MSPSYFFHCVEVFSLCWKCPSYIEMRMQKKLLSASLYITLAGSTEISWHPLSTPPKKGTKWNSILLETALMLWWLACSLAFALNPCRLITALGQLAARWRFLQVLPHASVLEKHCTLQEFVWTVHRCCSFVCRIVLSGSAKHNLIPLSTLTSAHGSQYQTPSSVKSFRSL